MEQKKTMRETKEETLRKKKEAREEIIAILNRNNVKFESFNDGIHLVVRVGNPQILVDFWPSGGLWLARETGHSGRGVFKLLDFVIQHREKKHD